MLADGLRWAAILKKLGTRRMVSRGAVATRREIPAEQDSLEETGGFISSIPALESAESLGPELIAFVKDVIKLDCVRESAKQRLTALLQKHHAL